MRVRTNKLLPVVSLLLYVRQSSSAISIGHLQSSIVMNHPSNNNNDDDDDDDDDNWWRKLLPRPPPPRGQHPKNPLTPTTTPRPPWSPNDLVGVRQWRGQQQQQQQQQQQHPPSPSWSVPPPPPPRWPAVVVGGVGGTPQNHNNHSIINNNHNDNIDPVKNHHPPPPPRAVITMANNPTHHHPQHPTTKQQLAAVEKKTKRRRKQEKMNQRSCSTRIRTTVDDRPLTMSEITALTRDHHQHFSGHRHRHRRRLTRSQVQMLRQRGGQQYYCTLCDVSAPDMAALSQHVFTDARHRSRCGGDDDRPRPDSSSLHDNNDDNNGERHPRNSSLESTCCYPDDADRPRVDSQRNGGPDNGGPDNVFYHVSEDRRPIGMSGRREREDRYCDYYDHDDNNNHRRLLPKPREESYYRYDDDVDDNNRRFPLPKTTGHHDDDNHHRRDTTRWIRGQQEDESYHDDDKRRSTTTRNSRQDLYQVDDRPASRRRKKSSLDDDDDERQASRKKRGESDDYPRAPRQRRGEDSPGDDDRHFPSKMSWDDDSYCDNDNHRLAASRRRSRQALCYDDDRWASRKRREDAPNTTNDEQRVSSSRHYWEDPCYDKKGPTTSMRSTDDDDAQQRVSKKARTGISHGDDALFVDDSSRKNVKAKKTDECDNNQRSPSRTNRIDSHHHHHHGQGGGGSPNDDDNRNAALLHHREKSNSDNDQETTAKEASNMKVTCHDDGDGGDDNNNNTALEVAMEDVVATRHQNGNSLLRGSPATKQLDSSQVAPQPRRCKTILDTAEALQILRNEKNRKLDAGYIYNLRYPSLVYRNKVVHCTVCNQPLGKKSATVCSHLAGKKHADRTIQLKQSAAMTTRPPQKTRQQPARKCKTDSSGENCNTKVPGGVPQNTRFNGNDAAVERVGSDQNDGGAINKKNGDLDNDAIVENFSYLPAQVTGIPCVASSRQLEEYGLIDAHWQVSSQTRQEKESERKTHDAVGPSSGNNSNASMEIAGATRQNIQDRQNNEQASCCHSPTRTKHIEKSHTASNPCTRRRDNSADTLEILRREKRQLSAVDIINLRYPSLVYLDNNIRCTVCNVKLGVHSGNVYSHIAGNKHRNKLKRHQFSSVPVPMDLPNQLAATSQHTRSDDDNDAMSKHNIAGQHDNTAAVNREEDHESDYGSIRSNVSDAPTHIAGNANRAGFQQPLSGYIDATMEMINGVFPPAAMLVDLSTFKIPDLETLKTDNVVTAIMLKEDPVEERHTIYAQMVDKRPATNVAFRKRFSDMRLDHYAQTRLARWEPYWDIETVVSQGITSPIVSTSPNVTTIRTATELVFRLNRLLLGDTIYREITEQLGKIPGSSNNGGVDLMLWMLPVQPDPNRADCHLWPKGTFLQLNDNPIQLQQRYNERVGNKWIGNCAPLSLSEHIRRPRDCQRIQLCAVDDTPFLFVVALCRHRSKERLFLSLQTDATILYVHEGSEKAKNMIAEKMAAAMDDDIVSLDNELSFRLTCPFTKLLLATPVRGKRCHHFQVSFCWLPRTKKTRKTNISCATVL
jgi:hypothetical protein